MPPSENSLNEAMIECLTRMNNKSIGYALWLLRCAVDVDARTDGGSNDLKERGPIHGYFVGTADQ